MRKFKSLLERDLYICSQRQKGMFSQRKCFNIVKTARKKNMKSFSLTFKNNPSNMPITDNTVQWISGLAKKYRYELIKKNCNQNETIFQFKTLQNKT